MRHSTDNFDAPTDRFPAVKPPRRQEAVTQIVPIGRIPAADEAPATEYVGSPSAWTGDWHSEGGWSDQPGWSAGAELPDEDSPAADGTSAAPPIYKRTWVLLAFAGVGVLSLAVVGGYALSTGSSSSTSAAATSSTQAVQVTTVPEVARTTLAPLPPPPATTTHATTTSATSTTSSPPPTPAPPPATPSGSVAGTVVSKDGTNWVINTAHGPVTVAINASTVFAQSKKAHGNQFGVGAPVTIEGMQVGDTFLAQTVSSPKAPGSDETTSGETDADGGH